MPVVFSQLFGTSVCPADPCKQTTWAGGGLALDDGIAPLPRPLRRASGEMPSLLPSAASSIRRASGGITASSIRGASGGMTVASTAGRSASASSPFAAASSIRRASGGITASTASASPLLSAASFSPPFSSAAAGAAATGAAAARRIGGPAVLSSPFRFASFASCRSFASASSTMLAGSSISSGTLLTQAAAPHDRCLRRRSLVMKSTSQKGHCEQATFKRRGSR